MAQACSLHTGFAPSTSILVECSFGRIRYLAETASQTTFETTIDDLITGQYERPVRVIAFDLEEKTVRDISEDVAAEIIRRERADSITLTYGVEAFVEAHAAQMRAEAFLVAAE